MNHKSSSQDRHFRAEFEACQIPPASFNHRAHIRLAYTYLVENEDDAALDLMRSALQAFLRHNEMDVSKYHETMTRAWILAVRHFMQISSPCESADAFIEANPIMLDTKIMMTHYSAEAIFSPQARAHFVEPDLEEIPRHDP